MAWLAAAGIQKLVSLLWTYDFPSFKKPPFKPVWVLFGASALVSLVMVGTPDKLSRAPGAISFREDASENPIVQVMNRYRDRTRWVFTDRVIYAFHARLPVPPGIGRHSLEAFLVRSNYVSQDH